MGAPADPLILSQRSRVVRFAVEHRIPAMYEFREFVSDGGLLSYGPNLMEMFRRSATYVDRILKGAKAANRPVEQPTKFEPLKPSTDFAPLRPPRGLLSSDHVRQTGNRTLRSGRRRFDPRGADGRRLGGHGRRGLEACSAVRFLLKEANVRALRRFCHNPPQASLVAEFFGKAASLHPLRHRWPGLVRRLRGYYRPVRLPVVVHHRRVSLDFPMRPLTPSVRATTDSPGSRARCVCTCSGSLTARDPVVSRDIDTPNVAFRFLPRRRRPGGLFFRGCIPGLHVPLSTLRGRPRMTRGRCGSLLLHRMTLSFTTPRRFSPAHGRARMDRRDLAALATEVAGPPLGAAWEAPAPCRARETLRRRVGEATFLAQSTTT